MEVWIPMSEQERRAEASDLGSAPDAASGALRKQNRFELVGELVRIFCRGRRWYGNYQIDGRQHRVSLKTASKKQARRLAMRLEDEILQGRHHHHAKPPSIASVIDQYRQFLETEGRASKTLTKYNLVFVRMLVLSEKRGARNLLDLNRAFVDAYRHLRVAAGAAAKTVFTESIVLRQVVNFALSRDLINSDPLKGLKLKKPKPTPQPCWTREEVEKIISASREPQRLIFIALADSGMRIGELTFLTWHDVDFDHGVIHIRAKEEWKPKTGDQRAIPLTLRVRTMLESRPRGSRWVFTSEPSRRYPEGGHQVSERHLLVSLKRVLKKLGLVGHLHTFRHAFISHALTQGIPEAIVRQWVGHVDPEVMKLYTHIADESSRAAMAKLFNDQGDPGPVVRTKAGRKGGK
jgi:integrase